MYPEKYSTDQKRSGDLAAEGEVQGPKIDHTRFTQPALFSLEYALAELWRSWGVQPQAVLGHSVGEYVAACMAGIFSLEDGLKLIAGRGRLMGELPAGGEMAVVFAGLPRVEASIAGYADRVSLGAINGPKNIVISGEGAAIQEILANLTAEGIKTRPLTVSHAFHSPQMDPILDDFEQLVSSVHLSKPRIDLIANVTARKAGPEIAQAGYWRQHIRQPVLFMESIAALRQSGCTAFVEIGPNPTLLGMAQRCLPEEDHLLWLPSLRKGRGDSETILSSLGELYTHGLEVDWQGVEASSPPTRTISLPTYPFQRQRYWAEPSGRRDTPTSVQARQSLLSAPARTPGSSDTVFSLRVTGNSPAFVADHQIYGTVIFPGSGYLSLAVEAANQLGSNSCRITDFEISEALVIPEGKAFSVQMVMKPQEPGTAGFEIFSTVEKDRFVLDDPLEWKKHASGVLSLVNLPAGSQMDVAEWQARCEIPVEVDDYYRQLAELGLNYGPRFHGLQVLRRSPQGGEALGEISLAEDLVAEISEYRLHPGVLDACFQILGAALPERTAEGEIYMPVGLAELNVIGPMVQPLSCHVQLLPFLPEMSDVLEANLDLVSANGQTHATLQGLRIHRASRQLLQRLTRPHFAEWFYELDWRPLAYHPPVQHANGGNWLIFADQGGVGIQLSEEMHKRGADCTMINWHESELSAADVSQLLEPLENLTGAIYLWGLDAPLNDPFTVQKKICGNLITLVKALEKSKQVPKLWLLTQNAQPAGIDYPSMAIAQSTLWGLGRTLALEYPQMWGGLIDLDEQMDRSSISMLADQLLASDSEDQVAYRQGQRYVARLSRFDPFSQAHTTTKPGVHLTIPTRGTFDNLALQPSPMPRPGAGEVTVQVRAAGLNFRDVLNALGLYPGDPGPLGDEFAGVIVAVGEGVTQFAPGQAVMGLASGSFGSYVASNTQHIVPKPASLSFEEAATIPIAFLTAYYALHKLAGLSAGQSVLIHAASGGVGMAATQIAQWLGAEIFATAGSPEKRSLLQSLHIAHIMNSRTLDFSQEVLRQTGGQGVDVVLNSLAGEFIPKSLAALKPDGHFLEIGKTGIWSPDAVRQVRPSADYSVIFLGDLVQNQPEAIQAMLEELMALFDQGVLTPLPHQVFPLDRAEDAFRFMAQARHVGKNVIQIPEPQERPAFRISPDKAYLVSGGLGGIGRHIARWLASQGARHIALAGRSGAATPQAQQLVAELEQAGVQVCVYAADFSQSEAVSGVLAEIENTLPDLGGVIHAAGVTEDRLLTHLDWQSFERVLAPKVAGAWNLHLLTQSLTLDFFVLFSAGAGLFGSPGQSGYAAANAFLDALAYQRKALGLPGLSINWGEWSGVGMAERLDSSLQNRWQAMGIQAMSPDEGIWAFNQLISMPATQVAVLPIQWNVLIRSLRGAFPPLLHDLTADATVPTPEAASRGESAWLERFLSARQQDQQKMLIELLSGHAAKVLGIKQPQSVDIYEPLTEMGLDSLMAVEFINQLRASLRHPFPFTIAFEYRTIDALVEYLQAEIIPNLLGVATETTTAGDELVPQPTDDPVQLLNNLDDLSDDEVDRLLQSMESETDN